MKYGAGSLSDAELLAILIRSGTGKITAVDLAKKILMDFRSLDGMVSKTVADFKNFKGVGNTKAISLIAAFEIGRRASVAKEKEKIKII
jgi:DNA repair protein RadC